MFNGSVNEMCDEMRDASLKLRAAIDRERRASRQAELWKREWAAAWKALEAEQQSYGEVSMRWDPEKNVMTARLEACPDPTPGAAP